MYRNSRMQFLPGVPFAANSSCSRGRASRCPFCWHWDCRDTAHAKLLRRASISRQDQTNCPDGALSGTCSGDGHCEEEGESRDDDGAPLSREGSTAPSGRLCEGLGQGHCVRGSCFFERKDFLYQPEPIFCRLQIWKPI